MKNNILKNQLNVFNNLIDYLIKGFTKYNLDEFTVLFLAKRTKGLMNFTHIAILNTLFKILKTFSGVKNLFDKYIFDTNEIIDNIFIQIKDSLSNILSQKAGIDNQEDIDNIVLNLKFVKKIILNLSQIAIAVLKYQSNVINENEFKNEYRKFKEEFDKDKKTFEVDIKK